jgi:hypothetical protein
VGLVRQDQERALDILGTTRLERDRAGHDVDGALGVLAIDL